MLGNPRIHQSKPHAPITSLIVIKIKVNGILISQLPYSCFWVGAAIGEKQWRPLATSKFLDIPVLKTCGHRSVLIFNLSAAVDAVIISSIFKLSLNLVAKYGSLHGPFISADRSLFLSSPCRSAPTHKPQFHQLHSLPRSPHLSPSCGQLPDV